jgi:hypothetical protein
MLEKESELRRKKHSESAVHVKDLSKEEREQRIAEMEKKAQVLDYQRTLQIEEKYLKNKFEFEKKKGSNIHKPEFLKNIEKDTYLEGKISMSDRVKRNMSTNIKHDKH